MKRACICLLLILLVTYIKEGYELVTVDTIVKSSIMASLSDVAEEVTAIPLETTDSCKLSHVRLIKRDGDNLFLVNKRQLYHFSNSGKFINQITYCTLDHPNNILVADYVIDPVHKQLIVMDEEQNAHYYNYQGNFLGKINLSDNRPWNSLIKLTYYDHHIWATAERTVERKEYNNQKFLEQWLYKFDTIFNEVESRKLNSVDLGRFSLNRELCPEVAVANEKIYVQSPSLQPEELLQDTLYLISRNKLNITNEYSDILPLRIGSRFLVSTYYNPNAANMNYTYCFDLKKNYSYNVKGGLEDNFYGTGQIAELQAMDVHSNYYCYCKMGEEVEKAFPGRTENDNPVLFIVKLKA